VHRIQEKKTNILDNTFLTSCQFISGKLEKSTQPN